MSRIGGPDRNSVAPSTAQCTHKIHGGDRLNSGKLNGRQLRLKYRAVRVDHVQIIDGALPVLGARDMRGARRGLHRLVLRLRLLLKNCRSDRLSSTSWNALRTC